MFLSLCTGDNAGQLACMAYIDGFLDGMLLQSIVTKRSPVACIPSEGRSKDQMRRIIVKHLEDNPKDLHLPARVLVLAALADNYPCKK
jgi:hypothetical protein